MQPYLIEGLDCSGKKTLARLLVDELERRGFSAQQLIGPLVGGKLARLDNWFANRRKPVPKGSCVDILRRTEYLAQPVIDGLFWRRSDLSALVKVSSHYRAWARARLDRDATMENIFRRTSRWHIRFAGATLLNTDFVVRLARHAEDEKRATRPMRSADQRFLGPDEIAFTRWQAELDQLLTTYQVRLLRLDSTALPLPALVEKVAAHALASWAKER